MRTISGQVIDGKVVVEDGVLEEGAIVGVLVPDAEQTFEVAAAEESRLLESIAECERGDIVTAEELFARLRRST